MPPSNNGSSISERARTGGGIDPQDGLFDKQFASEDLEAALEEREQIRVNRAAINKEFKTANEAAKQLLAGFELAVGEVARVGRFRIKKTATQSREVSFETAPGERLNIGVVEGWEDA